jgi:thymidine phosphorylase
MVSLLGGPTNLLEDPDRHLPTAPVRVAVLPTVTGTVHAVDVRSVGMAIVSLGGGRARVDDTIDPSVGLTGVAGIGEAVGPDRPLAIVHARSDSDAAAASAALRAAFTVQDGRVADRPVVLRRVERS